MTDAAPDPELYNGKSLDQLSDAEVLVLAGGYGPAIIGQQLFDRAQTVKKNNPGGHFGPALLDPQYGRNRGPVGQGILPAQSDADTTETLTQAWAPFSRTDLVKLAAQEGVSHKAKASRTDLINTLMEAGVAPPDIADFEAFHGAREKD